jgi:hypothetical protein
MESASPPSTTDALETRPELRATCYAPPMRDCSFYASCLEASKPCGAEGYALGYGDKYCNRFLANDALSERGAVWRDEVMVCLQRGLGRFLGDEAATCRELVDGAFDDHPACYTQPHASICDLPPSDWLSIVQTIDQTDLLSSRGRKQIAATARSCLQQWSGAVFSPFTGHRWREAAHDDGTELIQKRALVEALARDPAVSVEQLRALATSPVLESGARPE